MGLPEPQSTADTDIGVSHSGLHHFAFVSHDISAARRKSHRAASSSAPGLDVTPSKTQPAIFELARATKQRRKPSAGQLLVRRPLAAVALVPQPAVLFAAGAFAGALGKTLTAPLDRVKLLLQTQGGFAQGGIKAAAKRGNVIEALVAIGRQEGLRGYWRGNLAQILKVIPYSATQLYSYEVLKRTFQNDEGKLSVPARLAAGACAGMTATLVTYPLDTLRVRMAVDPTTRSFNGAIRTLLREGSYHAFFRGLGASLIGIAPYMAMELCIFDVLPKDLPPFIRGFSAALFATTACYPLDTIRRQIQLQSTGGLAVGQMAGAIWRSEGVGGFYRGFVPSAVKNLPNKGLRLTIFDGAKKLLTTSKAAYEEEMAKYDPLEPSALGQQYRL